MFPHERSPIFPPKPESNRGVLLQWSNSASRACTAVAIPAAAAAAAAAAVVTIPKQGCLTISVRIKWFMYFWDLSPGTKNTSFRRRAFPLYVAPVADIQTGDMLFSSPVGRDGGGVKFEDSPTLP